MQDKTSAEQKQFLAKHGEELKTATDENSNLVVQLQEVLIGQQATKAISDANGAVDLLIHPVRAQTRMVRQENGTYQVEVLDADGNARISPTAGSMEKMSIPDLVKEFRDDDRYARAFDGSSAQGSGSGDGGESSSSSRNVVLSAVDAKDPAKYRKAKALAEKRSVKLELRK